MIQRRQHARRLRAGRDIAGVLVFQSDDYIVLRRQVGQRVQGFHDAVEAGVGIYRAPVRKHTNNACAGAIRNLQRARREPRLIREGMDGGEHVLLEAGIHVRRIRQDALQ